MGGCTNKGSRSLKGGAFTIEKALYKGAYIKGMRIGHIPPLGKYVSSI